jgi:porin
VLYNTEMAQVTGFLRKPVQTMEYPFEIHYSFNFRWGAILRPNVQIVRSPGGVSASRAVVVLGLHTSVEF